MQAYLSFNGNAAEAMAFYAKVLGGKLLHSQTYGESPMGEKMAEADRKKIIHATLEAGGHQLMAADMPAGMPFKGYNGFSLSVQAKTAEEGKKLFDALGAGGKVTMPFEPTFWAAGFGMLEDQFGVPWMVNVDH